MSRKRETPSLRKGEASGGAAGASAASQGSGAGSGGAASQGSVAGSHREFTARVKYMIPKGTLHKKLYVDHVTVTRGDKPDGLDDLDDTWQLPVELVGKWARVYDFAIAGDKISFTSFQVFRPHGELPLCRDL